MYFDTQEKCAYLYYDIIEQISPKFILNAYDLLSYFSEDKDYYHYIIINPLELSEVDDYQINKLPSLLRHLLTDFEKIALQSKTIYDKPFYGDFIIDKKEIKIKSLTVKTMSSLNTFNTRFSAYDIEREKFNGIHSLENCTEYKE